MLCKIKSLRKLLVFLPLLVTAPAGQVSARALVDLDKPYALGTVVIDREAESAYFSLGNGRAIRYGIAASTADTAAENASFKADEGTAPDGLTTRRNIRWRK